MPAKKKPMKAAKKPAAKKPIKKAPKAAPKRSAPRPAPKKSVKSAPARKSAPTKKPAKAPGSKAAIKQSPLAKRMALFSQKVVEEEAAPVALRTFNELRAGIEVAQKLDVRTGQVVPVATNPPKDAPGRKPIPPPPSPSPEPSDDEDDEDDDFDDDEAERDLAGMNAGLPPRAPPKLEPLAGQASVPKRTNPLDEDFQVGRAAKKGKKGAPPTKEEFGKIELRMQRGTKDEAIATASPDYLQRSFNQAAQKGKVAATSATRGSDEAKPDEFEVAMDKGKKRLDAALTDFGDIEIAQQTRRGAKKVGNLDVDDEDKEQTS